MSLNINHKEPKNWRELQSFVNEILHECGYITQIEKTIQTLRGKVEIDVYAEKEEGVKTIILCECKFWKNNIPQNVVHSLRSVVNDYGATNGFVISKVGFQSGAKETIEKSNITLLTWADFQELFLSKWLDNIIERNHRIGKELLPFTTGMGFFYDLYQTLDEEKQKEINSVIESYSRFEIFSQKDLYFDLNENKISKKNIDEIINELKLKLPIQIQSYQDYFNFIYKYCNEALTKIDLIIGERVRKKILAMNKALKYATNGALIFGIGNAAINVFQQLNNQNSNQKFDWLKLLKAFENGVLVGGTGGFAIGLIRDNKMSKVITSVENVSKYLTKTLNYYKDDNKLLLEKAEKVRKKLDYKFNKELANYPNLNGSITKDTSIYGSDIDIQIPFKRDFGSIENVYYTVSDFIFDEFQDTKLVGIREQKHSIGLEFNIGNEIKRIDVIPLRQIDNNSGDTYLYVNNTGFFEKPTYKKTNYLKQLKKMQFSTNEKKIIRLLKVWKVENNLKLKSIHIEFLVKKAFEKKPIPYGIEKCLLETINFLAENIMLVKIIDPANTNNIISNSLTFKEKESISEFCYKMIENITQDERNIIDYFPSLESKILNF